MAAPEAAGELVGMERVSNSPRPTTTADTAPKRDPTKCSLNHSVAARRSVKFYF